MNAAAMLRVGRRYQRQIESRGGPTPTELATYLRAVGTLDAAEQQSGDLGFGPLVFVGWALASAVAALAGIAVGATVAAGPGIKKAIETGSSLLAWAAGLSLLGVGLRLAGSLGDRTARTPRKRTGWQAAVFG